MTNPAYFDDLIRQGHYHIPVTRELVADFETPLSCYVKVARGPYSYLLESANQGGEKWSRYSIIGLPASRVIKVYEDELIIEENGEIVEKLTTSDPLGFIEKYQQQFSYPELSVLPGYTGGLVGYFGYDTVRYVEKKLAGLAPPDKIGTADILLMVSNELIVFDNIKGRMHLVTHAQGLEANAYEQASERLDEMQAALLAPIPDEFTAPAIAPALYDDDFVSSYGEEKFKADVEKIKDYILAGDVMQVVLSQRMSCGFEAEPLNLYRALRAMNPSPYMYFMDLESVQIVSSSPEILARLENREATVRPLAGTRPRGLGADQDLLMEEELLNDPKEVAEHLMLIDLGRNDIGRVAKVGTVKVSEMMVVERYAHVMHMASNVNGELRDELSAMDLLRATLPVGTLSGAPKVRALEIIDELEPVKRGIFGGAVGYFSWNGNMDTAIAIRTAVLKDGRLHIQAGAGVVADSIPQQEWTETMAKAMSVIKAAAIAESGLRFSVEMLENRQDQR
jgi:anthranilate synthase component 1